VLDALGPPCLTANVGLTSMNLTFSRRLAIAIGLSLALAETLRLWGGGTMAWGLDHYLMGALLLHGAWRSRRYDMLGSRCLVAAWAFTCGVGYMNLFRHLERIHSSGPGQIPHPWVAGTIGFGWLLCILGLGASLKAQPGAPPNGGPAEPRGTSGVRGGPPSVS
jgi:hypothetical protein